MKPQLVPMSFGSSFFTCPFCLVNSQQGWFEALDRSVQTPPLIVEDLVTGRCLNCQKRTVWYRKELVFPKAISTAPEATEYMPEEIVQDFREAREVIQISPRASCALLRLCIQKICILQGKQGRNLNRDIGDLVLSGLSTQTQRALDVVRIIGNRAVHPSEIFDDDSESVARYIFDLVNSIVDDLFGKEKKLQQAYLALPQELRDEIDKRDKLSNKLISEDGNA